MSSWPRSGLSVTGDSSKSSAITTRAEPVELKLDHDRINYWLKCGAQPTDTVRNLIRKSEQQKAGETAQ